MTLSTRIGIIGTGFIATSLARLILAHPRHKLSQVLTRRPIKDLNDSPASDRMTQSLDELIDSSDIVIECTGDVARATEVATQVVKASLPMITMNSEFHVTTGSYFADKLYLSEAEGDQPGCLAALTAEARQMGFDPLVFGNLKGFLEHNPTPDNMHYWSERQGISLKQTTSFTDGTKIQIEQCFVANGLGGTILQDGLLGMRTENYQQSAKDLAAKADRLGQPVADYLIGDQALPPGVFVAARHLPEEAAALKYYKLGDGPYYVLTKIYHLCAFEMLKTVDRCILGLPPLLNNSTSPTIGVAAIAKRDMARGDQIAEGIGGFDLRGECIRIADHPGYLPVGAVHNVRLKKSVEAGQMLCWDDIDVEPSPMIEIAHSLSNPAKSE